MKTILCLFVLLVSGVTASVTLASDGGVDHKTSICHRTSSEKNPWVLITPDKSPPAVVERALRVAGGVGGQRSASCSASARVTPGRLSAARGEERSRRQ